MIQINSEEENDNINPKQNERKVIKKKKIGPFAKLGLDKDIIKAINRQGFRLPTPIQRKCIPLIVNGSDVIGMARTGSGKTAAFGLPLIQKLKMHSKLVGIRAVILEPTRELALQVSKVLHQFAHYTDLRIYTIIGGSGINSQFEKLSRNPDVIVASPGRLVHHIVEVNLSLSSVEYVVIDEGDQMLEMGMSDQLFFILKKMNPCRQCVIMSATLPNTLCEFSQMNLRTPEFIRLDLDNIISDTVDPWFIYIRFEEKIPCLLFLLKDVLLSENNQKHNIPNSVMIFVSSRHHVEFLSFLLEKAEIKVTVAHGSMDHEARIQNMEKLRKGICNVMIVTDVAARGLDIPVLGSIINFDFPMSPKNFIHRVGRVGRCGRKGLAISLLSREEFPYVIEVSLFCGIKLEIPAEKELQCLYNQDNIEMQLRKPSYIGTVPCLRLYLQYFNDMMKQHVELNQLYKVMINSYSLYRKIRQPASVASLRKAKDILDEYSHKLNYIQHPTLLSMMQNEKKNLCDQSKMEFIQQLHAIKPRTTIKTQHARSSGVLSQDVVHPISALVDNNQKHKKKQNNLKPNVNLEKVKSNDQTDQKDSRAMSDLDDGDNNMDMTLHKDLIQNHKDIDMKPLITVDNIFDWKSLAKKSRSNYFLSTDASEISLVNDMKEKHLKIHQDGFTQDYFKAMMDSRMNILPDEDQQRKHTQHVRKWNASKKKYMMTPIDSRTSRVLSSKDILKRKNVSLFSKEDLTKKGLYDKWVKQTKKYIPKIGQQELDCPFTPIKRRQRKSINFFQDKNNDNNLDGISSKYHQNKNELLNAFRSGNKLTSKQNRKLKQYKQVDQGVVRKAHNRVRNEIYNVQQLIKKKKIENKEKGRAMFKRKSYRTK